MSIVSEKCADAGKRILHALLEPGVELLVRTTYRLFDESPVLLLDVDSRLIAQYPKTPIGDEPYDTVLIEKAYSPEASRRYFESYSRDKYTMWDPYYANQKLHSDMPRYLGIVACKGEKRAVLAVITDKRPCEAWDMEIFRMLLDAFSVKLYKDAYCPTEYMPPNVASLLSLLESDSTAGLRNISVYSLTERIMGDYAIIVTPFDKSRSQHSFSNQATTELMNNNRNIVSAIHKNNIVTLIGEVCIHSFNPSTNTFVNRVVNYLNEYNMKSGISQPFHQISHISDFYRQAELTAQIAEDVYAYYIDLAPRQIYKNMANLREAPVFVDPLFQLLKDEDAANNTEYFRTLCHYCYHLYNRDDAADSLAIHRNTLTYRLNRLYDLYNVDLSDHSTRLRLLSSVLLLRELDRQEWRVETTLS